MSYQDWSWGFIMLDIRLHVEVKDQNMVKHPLGIHNATDFIMGSACSVEILR